MSRQRNSLKSLQYPFLTHLWSSLFDQVLSVRLGHATYSKKKKRKPLASKAKERIFNGFAYIEFRSKDVAQKFVEDKGGSIEYEGIQLELQMKSNYAEKKIEEHKRKKQEIESKIPELPTGRVAQLAFQITGAAPELEREAIEKALRTFKHGDKMELVQKIVQKVNIFLLGFPFTFPSPFLSHLTQFANQ